MLECLVPKDSETTIDQVKSAVKEYLDKRGWNGKQNPKNVAGSIMIEAAELYEHFQWASPDQAVERINDPEERKKIRMEMGDVLFYLVDLAEQNGIDLSDAFFEKLEKIKKKYPEGIGLDHNTYHRIKDQYRKSGDNQ